MRINDIKEFNVKGIGRCLNLLWIDFTNDQVVYSLHIQCAWRLVVNNKIILSNIDLYEEDGKRFDLEKQKLQMHKVTKIEINSYNDLVVNFDDGSFIQVFVNDYDECWRFFEKGKVDLEHFVVYANEANYE